MSIGAAKLTAEQTAAARSGAAALIANHVANSGQVVAIAPGEGPDAGQWVIVTAGAHHRHRRLRRTPPRSARHARTGPPPRRRMGRQRVEPRELTKTAVIALDASGALHDGERTYKW